VFENHLLVSLFTVIYLVILKQQLVSPYFRHVGLGQKQKNKKKSNRCFGKTMVNNSQVTKLQTFKHEGLYNHIQKTQGLEINK
jgi:hypothetical protein